MTKENAREELRIIYENKLEEILLDYVQEFTEITLDEWRTLFQTEAISFINDMIDSIKEEEREEY